MKTLITGGLGFIGSHLAKKIEADIFDRKEPYTLLNWGNLDYENIFHLAASTYLVEGYDRRLIEDNIVLSVLIKQWFKMTRIVYASSASIYNPNNLYSYSKKYCEDLFADCNAVGLRYYNVYGVGDNGIVGKLINAAITGQPITINGGEQTRDFVYVDEVVNATIEAVNSPEKIIEVGTGISTSINTLIEMVQDFTGKKINANYVKQPEFEVKESVCLKPLPNMEPLESGLKKTIDKILFVN